MKKVRRISRPAGLAKMGEKHVEKIKKQKDTRREMAEMKQKILKMG